MAMKFDPLLPLLRLKRAEQAEWLECLYQRCNDSAFRPTDPVEFLWRFDDIRDREIVAWLAAGLSYGRVAAIRKAMETLLVLMKGKPAQFLYKSSETEIQETLETFQYRWTRGVHVSNLLIAWKRFVEEGQSAQEELKKKDDSSPGSLRSSFALLRGQLLNLSPGDIGHLLPAADGPGACKRPAMMLRWMVRKDHIDPGDWVDLDPAGLWIPLDTHMFRMAKRLRFTRRNAADARAVTEITRAFARMAAEDPIRYDFGLTRLGMLPERFDLNGETSSPPPSR